MKTKNVELHRVKCLGCSREYYKPFISNFSYGEFVMESVDGKTFAYLSSYDNSDWDNIKSVFDAAFKYDTTQWNEYRIHFQSIFGKLADRIETAEVQIVQKNRCRYCQSSDLEVSETDVGGNTEIPVVTFVEFNEHSREEREQLIRTIGSNVLST